MEETAGYIPIFFAKKEPDTYTQKIFLLPMDSCVIIVKTNMERFYYFIFHFLDHN